MQLTVTNQKFHLEVRGVVVRPRPTTTCAGLDARPQTLVFSRESIYELHDEYEDDDFSYGDESKVSLSDTPLPILGTLSAPDCIVYEPTTDAVYYTEQRTAIMRLNADNAITRVAGFLMEVGAEGGNQQEAPFSSICSLAPDGKGNIFVSDLGRGIFRLELSTRKLVWLPGADHYVTALTYDTATDVLVGATSTVLFHASVYGGRPHGFQVAVATRDIAGCSSQRVTAADGKLDVARFRSISAILGAADGGLFILDAQAVRFLDSSRRTVTTLHHANGHQCWLTVLPRGQLVFGARGMDIGTLSGVRSFRPSCEVLAGWTRPPVPAEVEGPTPLPASALQAPDGGDGDDGGASAIVTVRVGGGRAYLAHRAVLVERSEYFRQRLAAGGGFADSGGQEVNLPEANPEAFGCLLSYMYGSKLQIPKELLRSTTELVGMLLMPDECVASQLRQQLLENVTPRTVVSELIWAERHSLGQLVPQLKAYLLKHRKHVAAAGSRVQGELMGLMALNPELAAEIILGLAAI